MQIIIQDLVESLNLRLDYIHKLLRVSSIKSRILLDKNEIIKFRDYLKRNCTTQKRYKLYIYINSCIINDMGVSYVK